MGQGVRKLDCRAHERSCFLLPAPCESNRDIGFELTLGIGWAGCRIASPPVHVGAKNSLRERDQCVSSEYTDRLALLGGLRGRESLLKLEERALSSIPGHEMRVLTSTSSDQPGAA